MGMCTLTTRERQCAALLAEGKRLDEAAHVMGISKRTFDFHLSNARRKLNAKTTTQAVLLYSACGCSSHTQLKTPPKPLEQNRRLDRLPAVMLARPASSLDTRGSIQKDVDQSYVRCTTTGRFSNDFYLTFMSSSPLAAERFADTDMDHQAVLLDYAIRTLILFFHEPLAVTLETIKALGKSHGSEHLNIPPQLYSHWLAALLATVKQHDPKFNRKLALAWTQVVSHGIAAMQSLAK